MASYMNIDNQGLLTLVSQIFGKVDTKLTNRTVDTIDENSDSNHVPSALAVFNALKSVSPSMSSTTVVGPIDGVENPSSTTIYLQKDDDTDETWTMYLYVDGSWVSIGSTDIDLSNYWGRDDIEEMRNLILDMSDGQEAVKRLVGYDALLKNDTDTMTIILSNIMPELEKVFVKQDDITTITTEDITTTVDNAFNGNYEITPPTGNEGDELGENS